LKRIALETVISYNLKRDFVDMGTLIHGDLNEPRVIGFTKNRTLLASENLSKRYMNVIAVNVLPEPVAIWIKALDLLFLNELSRLLIAVT